MVNDKKGTPIGRTNTGDITKNSGNRGIIPERGSARPSPVQPDSKPKK